MNSRVLRVSYVSSIGYNVGHSSHLDPAMRKYSRIMLTKVSCQILDPNNPSNDDKRHKDQKKKDKLLMELWVGHVQKFGMGLKDNLSPKHKGDWKDLTLMSLSFAVYVYMSQKIVCAYCAWMSMASQPW